MTRTYRIPLSDALTPYELAVLRVNAEMSLAGIRAHVRAVLVEILSRDPQPERVL